jgi:uncharacterized protein (DUF362 family)
MIVFILRQGMTQQWLARRSSNVTTTVRVGQVESYSETSEIRRFVGAALDMDSDIAALLADGSRERLVVVKPNWVEDAHVLKPDVWEPVITNPALLLALLETLAERMGGRGTVSVCDAPNTYVCFDAVLARGGFAEGCDAIRKRWPELHLEILDLRREVWICKQGVVVERRLNREDPRGYVAVDLGRESHLHGFRGEGRYYGADYDSRVVNEHHRGDRQEYLLAGTAVACDLFINVPKMKMHKKAGITCCLKNLVGVNGDKNWLPHYTKGSPETGGDEFPRRAIASSTERAFKRFGQGLALRFPGLGGWILGKMRNAGKGLLGDSETVVRNGNWEGNDTCWRMVLDLNRALLFANGDGSLREAGQAKKYLAIVDGVVGGEGNGPLCPDPVNSGVMLAGTDPAAVDAVAARLMGVEPFALAVVRHAFDSSRWPITDTALNAVRVRDESAKRDMALDEVMPAVPGGFRRHFGWPHLVRTQAPDVES